MTDTAGMLSRGCSYLPGLGCLLLVLSLAACTKDEDMDYCKNHYRFHDSHEIFPGRLAINLTEEGDLLSTLTLPAALLGLQVETADAASEFETHGLDDPARVYDLQSAHTCDMSDSNITREDDSVAFRYVYRCGLDNKLGQIDIRLFDVLPQLDEIEVNITTPVTSKHFAISRQCAQAIFRLK